MTARLIVVSGAKHRTHTIRSGSFAVGALDASDLVVDDPEVSKRHLKIERRGEQYWVVDTESRNGTFLNETRVDEAELHSGDRLRIGQTAMFFLQAERLDASTDGSLSEKTRGDRLGNLLILQE